MSSHSRILRPRLQTKRRRNPPRKTRDSQLSLSSSGERVGDSDEFSGASTADETRRGHDDIDVGESTDDVDPIPRKNVPRRARQSSSANQQSIRLDSDHDSLVSHPTNLRARKRSKRTTRRRCVPGTSHGQAPQAQDRQETVNFPPWTSLPEFLWIDIFLFAAWSYPAGRAGTWLAAATRICRQLYPAVVRALYRHPPLESVRSVELFTRLLASSAQSASQCVDGTTGHGRSGTNYGALVRSVCLDTRNTLKQNSTIQLLAYTPKIQHLELCSSLDRKPHREHESVAKSWKYEGFLRSLGISVDAKDRTVTYQSQIEGVVLQSFSWSSSMLPASWDLALLAPIHRTPHFSRIRKLSLVRFHLPSLSDKSILRVLRLSTDDLLSFETIGQLIDLVHIPEYHHSDLSGADSDAVDNESSASFQLLSPTPVADAHQKSLELDIPYISKVAASLDALPLLSHLVLEASSVANQRLLLLLPATITRLELIECFVLSTHDLVEFLVVCGDRLTHLVLQDNIKIQPVFLTRLSGDCPNLEELRVRFARAPRAPRSRLLSETETPRPRGPGPTWPVSLRELELDKMHAPCSESIEDLFQSLVDSAPLLPHLRRIVIKVSLNLPWRIRATFRQRWQETLQRVFLRQGPPPAPPCRPGGDRARTQTQQLLAIPALCNAEPPTRQSRRIAEARLSELEPESVPKLGAETRTRTGSGTSTEPSVHGLCDVVSITLDNQKRAERILGMDDFLDSEREDDDREWAAGMS